VVDSVVNENLMPKINSVYFQLFNFIFGDSKMMIVRYRTRGCAVLKTTMTSFVYVVYKVIVLVNN